MMIKEKVSVNELLTKKHRSKKDTLDFEDAVLTHYLQNEIDTFPLFIQEVAIEYGKELLKNNLTENEVIETSDFTQLALFEQPKIPFPAAIDSTFSFIDLFAGVGGFRMALQNTGGKCLYSSEFEPNAKFTYFQNYGKVPYGDITKDKVKAAIPHEFDILCGGFPCQAFSIAGHRKGFSDTRGTLFFDIEKIVEKHKPKVVFLENVKNLLTHDNGQTFRVIKEILEEKLGYVVYYKVLNSMTHANIPQNRERIFIVAFDPTQVRDHANFEFPAPIELTKSIHDVLEKGKVDDKYYYSKDHMYYPELDKTMISRDTVYQWRRIYVRENKNNVCPTLTANMGSGGHNVPLIRDEYGIRKLTPRECFSFQGYPKDFVISSMLADSKLYMQAGNSVTMPLIQRIGEKILEIL